MVIGGGPNRIGQGIEFDYCCVHAALHFVTTVMKLSWLTVTLKLYLPITIHLTDLYFEPITLEDVLEIVRVEKPKGVIVQYGGQTPLKLARELRSQWRASNWYFTRCD